MTIDTDVRDLTGYRDLLLAFEPHPIRTALEAERANALIDRLTDLRALSEGQREFIGLLGTLVYEWEEQNDEPITGTPQGVVQLLLEDRGLRQRDLVPRVFPSESAVSDFLAGRRKLSYERVKKLADFFAVSPALFYE